MKTNDLTIKQEAFCQAYLRLGDKSAAYREAYSCGNMKPETINRKAFHVFNEGKVRARVDVLREEAVERNKISIDELVQSLAGMVRFDIGDLYDDNGALLPIKEMPKQARMMIQQLDVDELNTFVDGQKIPIGLTKKVRTLPKLEAIEKLMKHLGGYEKDNNQKAPVVQITGMRIVDEPDGGNA